MYFLKSISDDVRFAQLEFRKHTKAKRLVLGSILACMATVFQVAGSLFAFYNRVCSGYWYRCSFTAIFPKEINALILI